MTSVITEGIFDYLKFKIFDINIESFKLSQSCQHNEIHTLIEDKTFPDIPYLEVYRKAYISQELKLKDQTPFGPGRGDLRLFF